MKTSFNSILLVLGLFVGLSSLSGQAVIYLQDDFDGGYQNNTALPLVDNGQQFRGQGYWNQNIRRGGRAPWVTNEFAQSGDYSVSLRIGPDSGQGAQQSGLTGFFSSDTSSANRLTPADAMRIRFAFYLPELDSSARTQLAVRGTDGDANNLAVVNFGGSQVIAQFQGGDQTIAQTVARDQWYFLEIDLPANPQVRSDYTVRLLDSTGSTTLGSVTGAAIGTVSSAGYSYFVINHSNHVGTTPYSVYLDTFSVQQIPEAETYGLILGALGGVFWLIRRRTKA